MTHAKQKGFTLIELIVAIAIVGLLATIAYPTYLAQTRKGRRSDALSSLQQLSSSLERCYATAYTYVGCAAAPAGNSNSLGGWYALTTAVTATTYSVTATPTGTQAADTTCATMIAATAGRTAADGGGNDTTAKCWGN